MRLALALALLAAAWGSARAEDLRVLAPVDGARDSGAALWLVVRSAAPPEVTVDGRAVSLTRSEGAVHHWRLEGLRSEGSRVAIRGPSGAAELTLFGRVDRPSRFHVHPLTSCAECHAGGETGCRECHRWPGGTHERVLAEGCARCHEAPEWRPRELGPVCGQCHPEHARGKHPRLRHPLTAARDPLRPGRGLDCASCHDPHVPRCLGCLGRGELQQWCKECHGRT